MMLGIFIFLGVALAMAVFLVVSDRRGAREDERALILAQEREHTARLNAEKARALRARWEARIVEDQLAAALADPRGLGDGLGRPEPSASRTGRFRRDAPVPLHTARDRG